MSKASEKRERETEAREALRRLCPPGTTVYGIVRSVSRSGMSRTIDFYSVDKDDGSMVYLTGYFSAVTGWSRNDRGALRVSGCGMDMIFHAVYTAARCTWRGDDAQASIEAARKAGLPVGSSDSDPGYVWRHSTL